MHQRPINVAETKQAEVVGANGSISGKQRWDASAFSAHHRRVLGLDLVNHADLARLAVRILIYAEIFLGHLVDVRVGAVLGDLRPHAREFRDSDKDCQDQRWPWRRVDPAVRCGPFAGPWLN